LQPFWRQYAFKYINHFYFNNLKNLFFTMSFLHSKGFKYLKNLIIGVGAAVVLIGALFKIMSWPGANEALTIGLLVEAGLFLMLGLIGPEPEYYWNKLYPGLDSYSAPMDALAAGGGGASGLKLENLKFNTDRLENQNDEMIGELRLMAKSLSSLKALQEVDFKETGEQVKKMGQFYSNLNEAMNNINGSLEDTRVYKEQLAALNQNLGSLNNVYGNMLKAMAAGISGKQA
jgi:hypothetical protein